MTLLTKLKNFWGKSSENRLQILLVLGLIILPVLCMGGLYAYFAHGL